MSGFGRRLMEKMGWSDGKGLGLNEDGMTEHVKVRCVIRGAVPKDRWPWWWFHQHPPSSSIIQQQVKQREESAGLGIEEHDRKKVNESWWFNSFEQALQSFRTVDDDSDDDDGGSKKKKRKKDKKKKDKKKKMEAMDGEGGFVLPSYDDLFKATGGKRLGKYV